jgi:DNA-binding transcriptional ArsR family regulator
MAALVAAGLVSATKRGLWVYYRLERDALTRVAGELTSL